MALTNAEKQARWQSRHRDYVKGLAARVAELEAENRRLRDQLEKAKAAMSEPLEPAKPQHEERLYNRSVRSAPGPPPKPAEKRASAKERRRAEELARRAEVRGKMQAMFAKPDPGAEKVRQLKAKVAAAHPDKGGDPEEFKRLHPEYVQAKIGHKEDREWRAREEARRLKRSAASKATWERKRAAQR